MIDGKVILVNTNNKYGLVKADVDSKTYWFSLIGVNGELKENDSVSFNIIENSRFAQANEVTKK